MTQLTPHFSLSEFTDSDTATRLGIDNDAPLEVVKNLKRTALGLELVRARLNNNAIRISSGYRCEALEKVLCDGAYRAWCKLRGKPINDQSWAEYFARKSHSKGEAADFTCPTAGTPEQLVRILAGSAVEFDQLIAEYTNVANGNGGWVHISFSDKPRRQVLRIDNQGTRSFT